MSVLAKKKHETSAALPAKKHRFVGRDGRANIVRRGLAYRHITDWYHWLLTLAWPRMMALLAGFYFLLNLLFTGLYCLDFEGLEGVRPGHYEDAFFMSVETLATLGYHKIAPNDFFTNCIMTLESLMGLMCFGIVTGLLFTRFSRPSAQVMFSRVAVIAPHEGTQTLMFRAANRRGNQLLGAEVHVSLSRNEVTQEGENVRRIYDLKLLRAASSLFNLTWTVRHPIDATSPLYKQTADMLRESETEIIVLLSGTDDVYGQTVHGRFAFDSEEILFGHRFVNMFSRNDYRQPVIDFSKFDSVEPCPKRKAAEAPEDEA